jgi:DNA polymerase-1
MLEMFRAGTDIHSYTASRMFGIPITAVDKKKHRYPCKRVGFGILYAMGAQGLQTQMRTEGIEYSEERCQELIDGWFRIFPKVKSYMESVKAEARRTGLVHDMFGRIRRIPETLSHMKGVVNAGLRQACNAPIQMGAQGIIKEAMRQLWPIYPEFPNCKLLIQVHDELIFEMPEEVIGSAVPVIQAVMENAVTLTIPTPVEWAVGQTWEELK